MKSLIHSQTSTAQPLKFGNGCVISSHTVLDMILLIHDGIKSHHVSKMGPGVINFKHDDVTKWKHFLRYWPFVRGIHRSPVNSLHKGQWCGALMFSLICAWINGWVNNPEAGDLGRYRAHYDVTVMDAFAFQRLVSTSDGISSTIL